MVSYKNIMRNVIEQSDILLEVVDSRFPDETRNKEVETAIKYAKKPFIIVMSKCDLVSKDYLEKAKKRLSSVAPTIFVSTKLRYGTTMLRHQILHITNFGGEKDIIVGCLGYPNTGKSSIINGVCGKHKASTSSISGYTKGIQIVNAGSRIKFIDTPGVIPFDEFNEYMHGLLGIKDATHLKDPIGIALKIIEKICDNNKSILENFYNITIEDQDVYGILEIIGKKTNCLKKKGEIDETRVGIRIVNDWQHGLLLL